MSGLAPAARGHARAAEDRRGPVERRRRRRMPRGRWQTPPAVPVLAPAVELCVLTTHTSTLDTSAPALDRPRVPARGGRKAGRRTRRTARPLPSMTEPEASRLRLSEILPVRAAKPHTKGGRPTPPKKTAAAGQPSAAPATASRPAAPRAPPARVSSPSEAAACATPPQSVTAGARAQARGCVPETAHPAPRP